MEEEYEENAYNEQGKAGKTVKTVLKILFIALGITVYGIFLFRSCLRNPEKHILYTKELKAALGSGDVTVYTQKPYDSINENEHGTFQFSIHDIYYIPETKQLQVTVRYNVAVLKDLKNEYGLLSVPEEDVFDYSLLLDSGTRLTSYQCASTSTSRYRFKYLVFDNVDLDDFTLKKYEPGDAAITNSEGRIVAHETDQYGRTVLYETDENGMAKVYTNTYVAIDVYYENDVDYEKLPLASMIVFNRTHNYEKLNNYKDLIDYDGKLPVVRER